MGILRHRYDAEKIVKHVGDPAAGILILSREIFNLSYIYFLFHEWLIENGYASRSDQDFGETYFMQRESTGGSEIRVRWRCTKKTKDPLFLFKLDINWWTLGLKEQEMVVAGRKVKMNSGELEIKLWPRLVINPAYTKTPFYKDLFSPKGVWVNHIIKNRVESLYDQLFDDAFRLQESLKTYMKIETYFDEPELKRFFQLREGE